MRTTASLCALGAGIACACTRLTIVGEETQPRQQQQHQQQQQPQEDENQQQGEHSSRLQPSVAYSRDNSSSPPRHHIGMSTAPSAGVHTPQHLPQLDSRSRQSAIPVSPFGLSTSRLRPRTPRTPSHEGARKSGIARPGDTRAGQRSILTPHDNFGRGDIAATDHTDIEKGEEDSASTGQTETNPATPRLSWLRRLSSNMSSSSQREFDRYTTSRPNSASISHASFAMSRPSSGILRSTPTPPTSQSSNRLVKRSSSLQNVNGSSIRDSPGSRLPRSVFRRPATSHDRSAAAARVRPATSSAMENRSTYIGLPITSRDIAFRHYFAPKMGNDGTMYNRRRNSTGIPNPIKRVYPDRKYTPILVSAREPVRPASMEVDEEASVDEVLEPIWDEQHVEQTVGDASAVPASSPAPATSPFLPEGPMPRRSFSISDLLSPGAQTLWRQGPSRSQIKSSAATKSLRRPRQRVASAPHTAMGGSLSSAFRISTKDIERPAKRRDLADLRIERDVSASPSFTAYAASDAVVQLVEGPLTTTQNGLQNSNFADFTTLVVDTTCKPLDSSPPELDVPPLTAYFSPAAHPGRVSSTRSELTSTTGSESDKSIGDVSTDYHTDTPYDSFPTRTTRSSLGKRGPHIETIFDESPPPLSAGRTTRLRDLLDDGTGERSKYRHSTIEEEESNLSTPQRSLRDKSVASTPSAHPRMHEHIFSSPPPMVALMPDPDDIDWDASDDPTEATIGAAGYSSATNVHTSLPFRFNANNSSSMWSGDAATPQRTQGSDRARLFDWSEAQPSPSHNQTPPRPRTVHGKKDPESRGSRSTGRRAPSAMHARSHSVPVVPDGEGKRSNPVANKFGTWGVGSKAVTEDWNEDFDFDDPAEALSGQSPLDERRVDSGHVMFVPKSIREQQENVVANIGLLREWGLLIEELKELRIRAVALGMLNGIYAESWREVDAMIELADQESQEATLAPRCSSPPSSPGFDISAFEDALPNIATATDLVDQLPPPVGPINGITQVPICEQLDDNSSSRPQTGRPRKDSEAVARTVIEALQMKRKLSGTMPANTTAMTKSSIYDTKKVPFDTATLRHIVPYVNSLKRRVKNALRETEGLYTSPRRRTSPTPRTPLVDVAADESPFRALFHDPESPSAGRRSRRTLAMTDHDDFDELDDTNSAETDEWSDVGETHI